MMIKESLPLTRPVASATPTVIANMNLVADAASIASDCHSSESSKASPNKTSAKNKAPNLPRTLMHLLNEKTAPEAIWWLPGEKEFAINSDIFTSQVLEVYFPGSKYASFIRRLHKLGFARQTRSLKKVYGSLPEHAVAFHHERFRRDRPDLLDQLKNGYWKQAKAQKARRVSETTSSSASVARLPAAMVEKTVVARPMSSESLPQTIFTAPLVSKQETAAEQDEHKSQADPRMLRYMQILEEEREIEARMQQLQVLLQQRRLEQGLDRRASLGQMPPKKRHPMKFSPSRPNHHPAPEAI